MFWRGYDVQSRCGNCSWLPCGMQNLLNDRLELQLRRFLLFAQSISLFLLNKYSVLHKIVCFLCNRDCFL